MADDDHWMLWSPRSAGESRVTGEATVAEHIEQRKKLSFEQAEGQGPAAVATQAARGVIQAAGGAVGSVSHLSQ